VDVSSRRTAPERDERDEQDIRAALYRLVPLPHLQVKEREQSVVRMGEGGGGADVAPWCTLGAQFCPSPPFEGMIGGCSP
jgi:hypothetical protein